MEERAAKGSQTQGCGCSPRLRKFPEIRNCSRMGPCAGGNCGLFVLCLVFSPQSPPLWPCQREGPRLAQTKVVLRVPAVLNHE